MRQRCVHVIDAVLLPLLEEPSEPAYVPEDVNWVEDVDAIMQAHCVGCHNSGLPLGGVSLETYDDTQEPTPTCGTTTVGEAILVKVTPPVNCGEVMPPFGLPGLEPAELKVIEGWIILGMPYGPETPVEPSEPTDPVDPSEPAEPNEPTEPTEPSEPTEPVEPVDPTDPGQVVSFEDVHPIFQASCSGWLCHQYTGFAQDDVAQAFQVVVDKDFADDIVDAILGGQMPVGNFGQPLCSGDPTVDTDPMCLTAEEQELVLVWYENYSGVSIEEELPPESGADPAQPSDPQDAFSQATFDDVHPIFQERCSGLFCHSGGFAGDNINQAYSAVLTNNFCDPILEAVQSGGMPVGEGCTGDPAQDVGKAGCLTQIEYDLLVSWVTGPVACPE